MGRKHTEIIGIKGYRNYMWEIDKDGRILNIPEHIWSDFLDATRYGMTSLIPVIQRQTFIDNLPRVVDKPRVAKHR